IFVRAARPEGLANIDDGTRRPGPAFFGEVGGLRAMPYRSNQELPESVKNVLPSHAQDIYREAFDNAWSEYSDSSKRRGSESQEGVAHKVSWAAVKKQYEKVGNEWQRKD